MTSFCTPPMGGATISVLKMQAMSLLLVLLIPSNYSVAPGLPTGSHDALAADKNKREIEKELSLVISSNASSIVSKALPGAG